jgi:glycosyltransferase involved in cell wall biosynthesis
MNISAIVLVKNNENTLKNTLKSLESFDDVVVYDNGSTDSSIEIAQSFKNVNLIKGDFNGFGWTKNKAVSFSKYDWVIIVDSDEVIDSTLIQVLKTKKLDKHTVYQLNFRAFYKNIEIKHCGWNNQKIKRLYNKTITSYTMNDVHEDIITKDLNIELLNGNVKHYSYHSISEFVQKADHYSTLFAENNKGKKSSSPLKAFLNANFSFFKTYFIKRGFLDGYAGLIIAFSHMATNFYKYMKLYEANKEIIN